MKETLDVSIIERINWFAYEARSDEMIDVFRGKRFFPVASAKRAERSRATSPNFFARQRARGYSINPRAPRSSAEG